MAYLQLLSAFLALHMVASNPFYGKHPFKHTPSNNLGTPLSLTSLIQNNLLQEAREAAQVHLDDFLNTTSYSGYFTVDEEQDANLFFWFFPSLNNYVSDPVVLWLQGGPGVSSLLALFTEHGPFEVLNGTVNLREYAWHRNYSLLYIDQPVGTGYSYTKGSLLENQTQVGDHLYKGLVQFFTLFEELQDNDFYVTGESYGGKYVPAVSYAIHTRNPEAELKINLKGLAIGNGLSDPEHQFKYGELLYQLGLIDLNSLNMYQDMENITVDFIGKEEYNMATASWNVMVDMLFPNQTALGDIYNFVKDVDDTPEDWLDFIVRDDVRQALHVGNQTYDYQSDSVYEGLYDDITRSVAPWVSELLSHYRVLIFNGQLDIIVGYVLTENYLQHLEFDAAEEYATAGRNVWKVGEHVAGYAKVAGNLTEVMVRNAGHMVPTDQPEFAFDLITRFIDSKGFD